MSQFYTAAKRCGAACCARARGLTLRRVSRGDGGALRSGGRSNPAARLLTQTNPAAPMSICKRSAAIPRVLCVILSVCVGVCFSRCLPRDTPAWRRVTLASGRPGHGESAVHGRRCSAHECEPPFTSHLIHHTLALCAVCNVLTPPPLMSSATSSSHPTSLPPPSPSPGTTRWRKPRAPPLTSCSTATCRQNRVRVLQCTSVVVRLCGGQPALVLILKPLCCADFLMAAPPLAGGATPIVRSDVVMRQLQVSCPFLVKCLCCANGKALFVSLLHRRPEPRRDRRAFHAPSVFLTGR
jgi:hypothetical protein